MYIKLTPNFILSLRYKRFMRRNGAAAFKWDGVFFLQGSITDLCSGATELAENFDKNFADDDDIYVALDIYE